jgi:hypothetical protein
MYLLVHNQKPMWLMHVIAAFGYKRSAVALLGYYLLFAAEKLALNKAVPQNPAGCFMGTTYLPQ